LWPFLFSKVAIGQKVFGHEKRAVKKSGQLAKFKKIFGHENMH
jgi:hypothetical protein